MAVLWLKAAHVIAVIAWMAGIFYLPRLFVYHADARPGSELSETFKLMELRLYRLIMMPALVLVWVTGPALALSMGVLTAPWLLAKLVLAIALTVFHVLLGRWRAGFARDVNRKSARFYRVINEVPTLLLIGIVILAVVKPDWP